MSKILSIFVILTFSIVSSAHQKAKPKHITDLFQVIEANDAGEVVYDTSFFNPFGLAFDHKFFHFERDFAQVSDVISPDVEEEFDLFIFVNLTEKGNGAKGDLIPPQHMQILSKDYRNQIIFTRNDYGDIVGFEAGTRGTEGALPAIANIAGKPDFPVFIPVSSGDGEKADDPQPYTNTFSGVFRVNHEKSLSRRRQTGMYDSLFVDVIYPWGKASGIAIHGTPSFNNGLLGSRQSHGCVRVHRDYSEALYEYVLSPEMYDERLVTFPKGERLAQLAVAKGGFYDTKPGYKALMIFFEGF